MDVLVRKVFLVLSFHSVQKTGECCAVPTQCGTCSITVAAMSVLNAYCRMDVRCTLFWRVFLRSVSQHNVPSVCTLFVPHTCTSVEVLTFSMPATHPPSDWRKLILHLSGSSWADAKHTRPPVFHTYHFYRAALHPASKAPSALHAACERQPAAPGQKAPKRLLIGEAKNIRRVVFSERAKGPATIHQHPAARRSRVP
jgi:hypothetical protein